MAFDIEAARKEGYGDADIANYLAKSRKFDIEGARKEGYQDQDIIRHLSQKSQGMGFNPYGFVSKYAQKGITGLGKLIGNKALEEAGREGEQFVEQHPTFTGQVNTVLKQEMPQYGDIPSKLMKGITGGYADDTIETPKNAGMGHKIAANSAHLVGMGLAIAPVAKGLQAVGLVPRAASIIGGMARGAEIGGLWGGLRKPEEGETRGSNALKDAAMFSMFEGAGGAIEALASKMNPTVKLIFDKIKGNTPLNSYEKKILNRFEYGRSAALGAGAGATEPAENWQERLTNVLTGAGAFGAAHGITGLIKGIKVPGPKPAPPVGGEQPQTENVMPSKETGIDHATAVEEQVKRAVNKPKPGERYETQNFQNADETQSLEERQPLLPGFEKSNVAPSVAPEGTTERQEELPFPKEDSQIGKGQEASVKMMITKADEIALRGLGYDQAAINKMKPDEAAEIISSGKSAEAIPSVRDLSLKEQQDAGWDENWPFVPMDLANKSFRDGIRDDPNMSPEEKDRIFTAAENLGVISKFDQYDAFGRPISPKGKETPLAPPERPPIVTAEGITQPAPPTRKEVKQYISDLKESKPVKDYNRIMDFIFYPEHGVTGESKVALYRMKGQKDKLITTLELRLAKTGKRLRSATPDEFVKYIDMLRTGRQGELQGDWKDFYDILNPLANKVFDGIVEVNPDMAPYRKQAHALMTLEWMRKGEDGDFGALFDSKNLEGTKNFLKKRSNLTASELIEAGYKLKSTDPVRTAFHTLANQASYVYFGKHLQDAIDSGRAVYHLDGTPYPKDFGRLNDPASNIYHRILYPEQVKMEEWVDSNVYEALNNVIQKLKIPTAKRVVSTGKAGVLGYAARDGSETVTRHNTELSVLAHEVGHQIDNKFQLWDRVVTEAEGRGKRGKVTKAASDAARAEIMEELRAIADLTGRRKAYARSKPEQIAQMVEAYVHAPQVMKEVAPNVWESFTRFVERTPELIDLVNLSQGLRLTPLGYEVPVPKPIFVKAYNVIDAEGNILAQFPKRPQAEANMERLGGERIAVQIGIPKSVKTGEWLFPKAEARMLNNYTSKDVIRSNVFGRGIMGLKNLTTGIELISGFHYATIAQEGVTSRLGLGIQQAFRGDMEGLKRTVQGGWGIGEIAKAYMKDPEGWDSNPENKDLMQREYGEFAPRMRDMVDAYFNNGGLVGHQDRSLRWGQDKRLEKIERWLGENVNEQGQKLIGGIMIPAKMIRFVVKDLLFERIIPNVKFSNFAMQYTYNLKQYAGQIERGLEARDKFERGLMTKEELERGFRDGIYKTKEELAFRAVRLVENKFGEMNWDNFWLNKNMKSALQLLFRSFTWQYGTWRGFGTAAKRIPEQIRLIKDARAHGERPPIDPDIAWVASLLMTHVAEAVLIGYGAALVTGNPDLKPKTWLDYIYPKIGLMTRVAIPGYVKEPISLWQDIKKSDFGIPTDMVRSKLSGFLGRISDISHNKDFYGTQVYDPEADLPQKLWQAGKHMIIAPFSWSSYQRERQEGGGLGMGVLSFMGIQKAPHWIEESEATTLLKRYVGASLPTGGSSQEAAEDRKVKKEILAHFRQGGTWDNLPQPLQASLDKMSDTRAKRLENDVDLTPLQSGFSNLKDPKQAINVWNKMTPEEKNDTADMMLKKLDAGVKNLENDPERLERFMKKAQPIYDELGGPTASEEPQQAEAPEPLPAESAFPSVPFEDRTAYQGTARDEGEENE